MFPDYEYRSKTYSIINFEKFINCEKRFHNHVEFGYITDGTLDVTIEDMVYTLKKGDLYIAFPNLIHAISNARAKGIVVIADPSFVDAYYQKLIYHCPEKPILRSEDLPEHICSLFYRLRDFSAKDNDESMQLIINGYINIIVGEIMLNLSTVPRNCESSLVQNIMMYVLNNYTEDTTLDMLSSALCYSKWYISTIISSTFGCNFRTLVNSYRVENAKNQLLSTNKTIAEIALECGFKNQSSFNRVFLTMVGITPSKFRQSRKIPIPKPKIYYAN